MKLTLKYSGYVLLVFFTAAILIEGGCFILVKSNVRYKRFFFLNSPIKKNHSPPVRAEFKLNEISKIKQVNAFVHQEFFTFEQIDGHEKAPFGMVRSYDGFVRPLASENWRSRATLFKNGAVVYDYIITTDKWSRRTFEGNAGDRRFHALFLGCSFVWGEGVQSKETLPFYFSQFAKSYSSYNDGYPGYGPNSILAKSRVFPLDAGISQKKGIAVYLWNDDHMRRVVGTMDFVTSWGHMHASYTLENGKPVYKGTFAEAWPFKLPLLRIFSTSFTRKFFNLDYPFKLKPAHYALEAEIVLKIKEEYLTRFPEGKFVVALYPTNTGFQIGLKREFERLGIHYLDYSDLEFEKVLKGPKILPDNHPSREAYQFLGRQIYEDLKTAKFID